MKEKDRKKTKIWKWTMRILLIFFCLLILFYFILFFQDISNYFFQVDNVSKFDNTPRGELLKVFLTFIAGIIAILVWHSGYKRVKVMEKQTEKTAEQIQVMYKGNMDTRFNNAVGHLGNENSAVILGGIHALHQIAVENENYRQVVHNLFCSYLRENSAKLYEKPEFENTPDKCPIIIQTLIDYLFRLYNNEYIYKNCESDLSFSTLKNCDFSEVTINDVNFSHSVLENCNFSDGILTRCKFFNGILIRCHFWNRAVLTECNFGGFYFENRILKECYFTGTFRNCDFTFTNLINCHFEHGDLTDCDFNTCSLTECTFWGGTLIRCTFSLSFLNNCVFIYQFLKRSAILCNSFFSDTHKTNVDLPLNLSNETYEAVIMASKKFNRSLALHFGYLSSECEDENKYLLKIEQLIRGWLKDIDSLIMDDIFCGDVPQKADIEESLSYILQNIEKVKILIEKEL